MRIQSKIKNVLRSIILMSKEKIIHPIIVPTDRKRLLDKKVALITGGGGSGIGYSIAKKFLESGAKIIIAGTNEQKIKDAIVKLNAEDERAKGIILDVRNTNVLYDKVKEAALLFEENRIDILVNSAGVISKNDFWNISEEEYDMIMDINAKGTFFMCQAVAKFMIEKNIKGHILNISSSSALRPAWTPYEISKWAIKGFTPGLADTLIKHGIIVNAIGPGPTATPMLGKSGADNIYKAYSPSERYALPEEVASLAVFMVSDSGDMIVGDTFYMTGGSGTITMHH